MTAGFSSGVPFAVDEEGRWQEVGSVARGKDCACFCAECDAPLIARKGHIRVHHFAHSDSRECQYALQASLFGMAATILGESGAEIQLPPVYSVPEMSARLRRPDRDVREAMIEAGLDDRLRGQTLILKVPTVNATRVQDSRPETPDIESSLSNLSLHFLSDGKRLPAIESMASKTAGSRVLAVNLVAFAWRWRQVCDQRNLRHQQLPPSAMAEFRKWLAQSIEGRGWIYSQERSEAEQKLRVRVEAPPPARPQQPLSISFFSPFAAPPTRAWVPKKKEILPDKPDEVLSKGAGVCQMCASSLDEVRLGSGLYAGKRVLMCTKDAKHPMKYLGS